MPVNGNRWHNNHTWKFIGLFTNQNKKILKGTIITQRARLNQIASRMHKMTVKTRPTLTKNFIPF